MTFLYTSRDFTSTTRPDQRMINLWKHITTKSNWRIVQLPNGFFQTEIKDINCACDPEKDTCCEKWIDVTRRETLEGAESAIDGSVDHYQRKLDYISGPKVVKTFK